jgi:NAD(P)-dependent dehydrogenase (short-subunit alcohol dehydrogenase family)
MKIAIIGAGRRRNGIGAYIARYAHEEGARVVAVLAQDESAARHDAEALKEYGIMADAYFDLDALIEQHRPDALAIASPAATHADYLTRAVAAGMHVLCEKPFIWNNGCDSTQAATLLEVAREHDRIVAMNSQWPFVLPVYEQLCGLPPAAQIESFYIQLAPLSTGRDMIPDAMPHALSMLYSVLGPGTLEQLTLEPGPDRLHVSFLYAAAAGQCRVAADLVHETRQPRSFAFGFNGSIARRIIDMATYRIAFTCGDRRCEAEDPLQLSVRDFLHACKHAVPPRIGSAHIVDTMQMLQQVYTAWPADQTKTKEC